MRAVISRRLLVVTLAVALGAVALSACVPQTEVRFDHVPVQGVAELTPDQLADYVIQTYANAGGTVGGCGGQRFPYRAGIDVRTLARLYVEEGNDQYIRGDIAFAQSILETGWFSFPDCGQVRPWYNNFAGIGAHDDGNHPVAQFASAHLGVRAQIQRLNWYSNAAPASSLVNPIVPQKGWSNASQYNQWNPGFPRGSKPVWQLFSGSWASGACYDVHVLSLYNRIRAANGLSMFPLRGGC